MKRNYENPFKNLVFGELFRSTLKRPLNTFSEKGSKRPIANIARRNSIIAYAMKLQLILLAFSVAVTFSRNIYDDMHVLPSLNEETQQNFGNSTKLANNNKIDAGIDKSVNSVDFSSSQNSSVRIVEYSVFSKIDNLKLNLKEFQNINQSDKNFKHILLTIHGYGSGSFEYENFAKYLAENYKTDVIIYDQRLHGEHLTGFPPVVTSIEDFEMDVLQILKFLRMKYESAKITVYGHSMGGAILVKLCLKNGDVLKNLGVTDFIFEAPCLQIYPSTAKFIGVTSAIAFKRSHDYVKENLKFWDKENFRTNIHIPVLDDVCDREMVDIWYDYIKGKNSQLIEYPDGLHNLKFETKKKEKISKPFFDNIGKVLKKYEVDFRHRKGASYDFRDDLSSNQATPVQIVKYSIYSETGASEAATIATFATVEILEKSPKSFKF